jgi:hypothetical protein
VTVAPAALKAWPPPSMVRLTGNVSPTFTVLVEGDSPIVAVWEAGVLVADAC